MNTLHIASLSDDEWRRHFMSKVERPSDQACWEWRAARVADGYGQVKRHGRMYRAHRVAYELFVGPIPDGLTLDHLCRNRGCVNPAHLEPVTQRVNGLRGESPFAQNARKTACPAGHPYDEANTWFYKKRNRRLCRRCQAAKQRQRRAHA